MTVLAPRIPGLGKPLQIVWDRHGFVHVFAGSVEDAYAGLGYAAGYDRLWQIHLSTLYATGTAASVLGRRFVAQDALVRTLDVPGTRTARAACDGDAIAAAYLHGLNAYVAGLDVVPAEFVIAGTQPRPFTLDHVAARHRFTSYHQHKPFMEKLVLARLMAAHGPAHWQGHVSRFTSDDLALAQTLREPYSRLSLALGPLMQPLAKAFAGSADASHGPGFGGPVGGALGAPFGALFGEACDGPTDGAIDGVGGFVADDFDAAPMSGSNNWAVRAARSASGKPLLATDPHQPHSLPNTFMYAHLSASVGGQPWDVMGATFPGVPYFMFGHTRDIAWGLTTGFVDTCDVYVERLNEAREQYQAGDGWRTLTRATTDIACRDAPSVSLPVALTHHGALLEPLLETLALAAPRTDEYRTALRWSSGEAPTPGGALTRLPLAKTVDEFGATLFDHGVTTLVNNIICVDRHDGIARWVAGTLPRRRGVSGVLPLPGWDAQYDFGVNEPAEMRFDYATPTGFCVTANNDTLGRQAPFPVHNYAATGARAERIAELVSARSDWTVAGFQAMQNDLVDAHARSHVPPFAALLATATGAEAQLAARLLQDWRDFDSGVNAIGPTVWHAFTDTRWPLRFMTAVLRQEGLAPDVLRDLPFAPGLNRWSVGDFLAPESAWRGHRDLLVAALRQAAVEVVARLRASLGPDPAQWHFGRAQHIAFWHSQRKHAQFAGLQVGPVPLGGSPTTIAMATHLPSATDMPADASGTVPLWRVFHGPAFRMVVDMAQPLQSHWVIAGGNSARADSAHVADQFDRWLAGELISVPLGRDAVLAAAERTVDVTVG